MSAPPSQSPANNYTKFSDFFFPVESLGFFFFFAVGTEYLVSAFTWPRKWVDCFVIKTAVESRMGRDLVLVLIVNKQI